MRTTGLVLLLTAGAANAQLPADDVVLVTNFGGTNPATGILGWSPSAGVVPYGRFASDVLPATAIEVDPYDRHVLIALQAGPTQTRIERLVPQGRQFAGAIHVGDLPGSVRQLAIVEDALLAVVDGSQPGLWRLPRRGFAAAPSLLSIRPALAACSTFGPAGTAVLLAWSGNGPPPQTAGLGFFDVGTTQFVFGPWTFPATRPITGVADMPTGLPRQLLAFADGSFELHVGGLGAPTPVVATPPVPPGGANAMKVEGGSGLQPAVLGGAAWPFLYRIEAFTGAVTTLAGPLPGDPVDFAFVPAVAPSVLTFGDACGRSSLGVMVGPGDPSLGNGAFGIDLTGATAGGTALFVAGFRDVVASGVPLPAVLPGGCLLHVEPAFVALHVLTASGAARQNLPIPPMPSLTGVLLFLQWLPVQGPALQGTPAVALQIA